MCQVRPDVESNLGSDLLTVTNEQIYDSMIESDGTGDENEEGIMDGHAPIFSNAHFCDCWS